MSIHTLHIEHVVLLVVYCVLTIANSLLYRNTKGIHWFSLYNVFALLGAVAVELRGQIPDFLSIVVGNLFVVCGYALLFFSLAALAERRVRQIYFQLLLIAVATVSMLQWGYLHPDTKMRLLAYSLVLFLQQAHIALFLGFAQGGKLRRVGSAMAVMMGGLAAVNVVRILGVSLHGAPKDYLQAGPFLAGIVVANTCLQCGAMVAYVWMTALMLRKELELQALTDPLTGILNRRAIQNAAEREIAFSRQRALALAVITVDLDSFKQINDSYGHHAGDATLVAVTNCLQQGMRRTDLLARTGGDEFTILLPRTTRASAEEIAERLRHSIESLRILHQGREATVTASFGVAAIGGEDMTWDRLIKTSDHALYEAKRSGGNLAFATPEHGSSLMAGSY